MNSDYQQVLAGENSTLEFGARLARATFVNPDTEQSEIAPGSGVASLGGVIHLLGDLGAGKTTLSRGFMRGYGYQGPVKSPTYTLVEPYEFAQCKIYHFDLYRLGGAEEVEYLGVEDYFRGDNLCLVEWAEKGKGHLPEPDLSLQLEGIGTERQLHCQTHTEKGATIAKRLWGTGRNL